VAKAEDEFVNQFSLTTIYGQPITDEIFYGKKLTMVCVWRTWCSPSIGEMPELKKLQEILPDDIQLVGIVEDIGADNYVEVTEKAKAIVEAANLNIPQIIPNYDTWLTFRKDEAGIWTPRKYFVDSKGLIGEGIDGAKSAEEYLALISDILGEDYTNLLPDDETDVLPNDDETNVLPPNNESKNDGSGGGGCNAGLPFGVLTLATVLAVKRRGSRGY
jgi:thiol-disulfide isomerase/thioredoxin